MFSDLCFLTESIVYFCVLFNVVHCVCLCCVPICVDGFSFGDKVFLLILFLFDLVEIP